MTLSVLICSLSNRAALFARVQGQLMDQIRNFRLDGEVEVLDYIDEGQHTIGCKRNVLKDRAQGRWLCYIDDDDHVCDSYLRLVVNALRAKEPDCVGIVGKILWKGAWCRFIHSLQYKEYATLPGPVFVRPPNHLNPVRAEIARQFRFPEINRGEDTDYAMTLARSGLLKTEAFVDEVIYFYTPNLREDRERQKPRKKGGKR